MLKFSFTYFGTSILQLQKILLESGLTDVSDHDILRQNPQYATRRMTLPDNWPNLDDLCQSVNIDHIIVEVIDCKPSSQKASKDKQDKRNLFAR